MPAGNEKAHFVAEILAIDVEVRTRNHFAVGVAVRRALNIETHQDDDVPSPAAMMLRAGQKPRGKAEALTLRAPGTYPRHRR